MEDVNNGITSAMALPPWKEQLQICLPGRGELTVRQSGPAIPAAITLIMLHGIVVDSAMCWSGVAAELADEFNIFAVDCYGHGSILACGQSFTLERYADDVLAAVAALGINNPIIVGHSLGGAVAQLMARKSREDGSVRPRGLIFSSTAARFSGTVGDWAFYRWISLSRRLVQLLPKQGQIRFGAWYSEIRGLARYSFFDDKNFDWGVLFDVAERSGRFDSSEWIKELSIPSYSIITTRGDVVSVAKQRELAILAGGKSMDVDLKHDYCITDPLLYALNLRTAISSLTQF